MCLADQEVGVAGGGATQRDADARADRRDDVVTEDHGDLELGADPVEVGVELGVSELRLYPLPE